MNRRLLGRRPVVAGVMVLLAGAIGGAVASDPPVSTFLVIVLVGAVVAAVLVGGVALLGRAARDAGPTE
ncbi:hypothetical protein AGMMS50218_09090 [Actinomycetota bacterium]|nr:hypothetical protein AGMMS50218_09090 [Actinomycetota bacterium]